MHATSRLILLTLALAGWAAADLPKKAPITKYTRLWTDSPFTSKPPPPKPGEVANPLEDYALAGVSPVTGGYRVTLLNKKKPDERIIVESDRPAEGFKIVEVIRKAGDPLGTVVKLMSGTVTGTVAFDEKLLTLKPPPAAKPAVNPAAKPGQPPGVTQPGQQPQRQPRPRVVPPPTPNTPQAQPPTNNQQRPSRRGQR